MAGWITPGITEHLAILGDMATPAILVFEGKGFGVNIRNYKVDTYLRWI